MIDWTDREKVKALKSNLQATFDSPVGKEAMLFIEEIGNWYPSVFDSNETNDIIARDANRKLIGTIKTIMELGPDQIIGLAEQNNQ